MNCDAVAIGVGGSSNKGPPSRGAAVVIGRKREQLEKGRGNGIIAGIRAWRGAIGGLTKLRTWKTTCSRDKPFNDKPLISTFTLVLAIVASLGLINIP